MVYPLLTRRLSIEPLAVKDIPSFVAYRRDPDVARYQGWDPTYSAEQAQDLVTSQAGVLVPAEGEWLQLAIRDRQTGELLGDLALHSLNSAELSFEIGFTLSKEHQRLGIAQEAARMLLRFLFEEVGEVTVSANCDSRNGPAIRLLRALGFKQIHSGSWSEIFKNEKILMNSFELPRQAASD